MHRPSPPPLGFRPLVLAALAAITLTGGLTAQTTFTWPGAAPCNTTLFDCIDAAASGDIVEVASNGPILESLEIQFKSLTLRAAAGFTPVIDPAPFTDAIDAFGADSATTIVIEGLTIQGGTITGYQAGSGSLNIAIRNNRILGVDLDANFVAIAMDTFGPGPHGPVDFEISGNAVEFTFLTGDDITAISIDPLAAPGPISGAVSGNTIAVSGIASTRGAIEIRNDNALALDVDVIANDIDATGMNGGVLWTQESAAGSSNGRIVNNLIRGTVDFTGPQPGGISLLVSQGTGDFTVVNNTIADGTTGVAVNAGPSGATLTGVLANNIVANQSSSGIEIGAALAATFPNDHNLVFGTPSNSFTPGPGTLTVDPQFVGGGDYHLQVTSPAIEAGANGQVPAGITTDLDGLARIQGPNVDMGVYEQEGTAPPTPAEIPTLGTWSIALLGALLGGAALARLRR